MTPPLMLRDVEVTTIDAKRKTFALLVHVQAMPIQMHSPEIQHLISHRVQYAVKYLVDEGFIPDPRNEDWKCILAGVCHPPTE